MIGAVGVAGEVTITTDPETNQQRRIRGSPPRGGGEVQSPVDRSRQDQALVVVDVGAEHVDPTWRV
ncbi:MAG: hypothetical protein O7A98_04085 [Acidobacteria bacterium]|nr:hypothetical protein [Acidobacteriota bacterium]